MMTVCWPRGIVSVRSSRIRTPFLTTVAPSSSSAGSAGILRTFPEERFFHPNRPRAVCGFDAQVVPPRPFRADRRHALARAALVHRVDDRIAAVGAAKNDMQG